FVVNSHTLRPRPETETMIDLLKQIVVSRQSSVVGENTGDSRPETSDYIVDVGTGSGCIGITAKLEFPEAVVIGTDIDGGCIEVSRQNARNLGAEVKFYKGNLLEPLPANRHPLTAVLANLPYVPDSHTINKAAMFEPKHA